MLERLANLVGYRQSALSSPFVARLFSVSRNCGIASDASEAAEKRNARQKLLYNRDAAYRQKELARATAWRDENREKSRQITRVTNRLYRQDAAHRQKDREHALRRYHELYSKDPVREHRRRLYRWVRAQFDIMSTLPWKTHRPLVHETKVEHFCQGCRVAKFGGSTVWWQQLDSEDQYCCPACYVKDLDASMPEGYEGITTWNDLVARKAELDALGQNIKSKP